jgi:hypothetical protein
MDDNGILWFGKRLCVLEDLVIRQAILHEAHESAYSIHPVALRCIWISNRSIGGLD